MSAEAVSAGRFPPFPASRPLSLLVTAAAAGAGLAGAACAGSSGGAAGGAEPPAETAAQPEDVPVERTMPARLRPGETATVVLRAETEPAGSVVVRESPPEGWVIVDVDRPGGFDTEAGEVRWRLTGEGSRELRYRIRPAVEARGTYEFSGRTVEGETAVPIGGDRSVEVAGLPAGWPEPGREADAGVAEEGPGDRAAGRPAAADVDRDAPAEIPHVAAPAGFDPVLPSGGVPTSPRPGPGRWVAPPGGTRGAMSVTTPGQLPPAKVGRRYVQPLDADGGRPPFVWTLEEGWLPPGLRLDRERGLIVGTPEESGLFDLTVSVGDPRGRAAGKALVLPVAPAAAAILVAGTDRTYDGAPKEVAVRTDPPGLDVEVTYEGRDGPPAEPGEYPVSVEVTADDYRGSAEAVLRIREPAEEAGGS